MWLGKISIFIIKKPMIIGILGWIKKGKNPVLLIDFEEKKKKPWELSFPLNERDECEMKRIINKIKKGKDVKERIDKFDNLDEMIKELKPVCLGF